jgi:phosphoribosyl 1,2-cyclic phosphodiesterase
MSISLCSFASGSSGNSFLVKTADGAVIIDAGISAKRILAGLAQTGTGTSEVRGVFITHEHSDHISGVRVLMKRLPRADLFASEGTLAGIKRNCSMEKEIVEDRFHALGAGETVDICGLAVTSFPVFHDAAEPFGYTVRRGAKSIGFITDTGVFTEEMVYSVAESDILILEANHDLDMLKNGNYPHYLKQRILGREGHLSNNQTAEMLIRIFEEERKKRIVMLAHLSAENNTPAAAGRTVTTLMAAKGYHTGRCFELGCLNRSKPSFLYTY